VARIKPANAKAGPTQTIELDSQMHIPFSQNLKFSMLISRETNNINNDPWRRRRNNNYGDN
jgi:hypothetical protein